MVVKSKSVQLPGRRLSNLDISSFWYMVWPRSITSPVAAPTRPPLEAKSLSPATTAPVAKVWNAAATLPWAAADIPSAVPPAASADLPSFLDFTKESWMVCFSLDWDSLAWSLNAVV